MESINLTFDGCEEGISLNHYNYGSDRVLVLVGGSGDNKEKLAPFVEQLEQLSLALDYVTFTFCGNDTDVEHPIHQQEDELERLLEWVQPKYKSIVIVCTSAGAFSTSLILAKSNQKYTIERAIYLDPADYPLDSAVWEGWNGHSEYNPSGPTASTKLAEVQGGVVIDVIYFTIRNFSVDGYVEPGKRGIDHPSLFTRLNGEMVRSFYNNTPERNQGYYLELPNLPHAFLRDGEVVQNIGTLADLIAALLSGNLVEIEKWRRENSNLKE